MTTAVFIPTEAQLQTLSLASPFAKDLYDKHTKNAQSFLGQCGLFDELGDDELRKQVDQFITMTKGDDNVMMGLRRCRQMLMLKWIWQDALGLITLDDLMRELSVFANACINIAKDHVYHQLTHRYGVPMTIVDGKRQVDEFAIIAMGKLGAMELNLSSDIDLIFIHKGLGETDISQMGKKSIDNQKFMTHLGRGVIRLLDEITADGFVFRVDMRLRPWGDGSALVMTASALEKYFNQHGRTWERFAWLKARVVNQVSASFFDQLVNLRKNFVYRYYIDYSAFGALREMKSLIVAQQTQRQDLDNVKLGVGGIRDIEFIVQAFALIYGGHQAVLGDNLSCLKGIEVLSSLGHLEHTEAEKLSAAYRFLRRLEHAIQARNDEQTQRLPQDELSLLAIAKVMGFDEIGAFRQKLDEHRDNVSVPFERMVTDRQSPTQELGSVDDIWQSLQSVLSDESVKLLSEFNQSKLVASLDDEPKSRLDAAYPIILHALLEHAKSDGAKRADVAVPRLIVLLESICRRSIYLVMIAENPNATVALIPMLSASHWIAKELALYPMLLDNFLQKRYLHLPNKAELTDILRQGLLRVERFDDESYLANVRLFKKTQVLAVATADVLGLRHIMKVSDSLTFIAEVVLESAVRRAFDELTHKHGYPLLQTGERANSEHSGFAVIGYGKLGGIEMSYTSDLDVVFLHNIDEKADTDGVKAVSGMKFASRLVQKVLSYLTTQTRDGRAYELDVRLRPSGNAGVMVVSVHAFELYQQHKAWAWEHQALVRARGVAGDKMVLAAFDEIRQAILTRPRELAQVRQEVLNMRQKMQSHLGTQDTKNHQFHIKQDFGGLVDIEFLAQFMVLSYAHVYPNLAIWSDNVRIFEEVAKTELMSEKWCDKLTQTYLLLRKTTHELALSDKQVIVDDEVWQESRAFVREVWERVLMA
ncbi:bifunctional [glutamate--ammonia ligase]-adenylyl-L-tyrosine phosphorylase/[glutamate--ammonia-ligase] adenylyltransferase [Moraxella haemolytica]|uniref:bifunctional [glutamate--ammonia ligase]-adenylyl-L-tyrosine phosphorylase/[glutamate--ammonia-ligase] adenylyltransferase n=1 Tax=Moraxella haemolytica TaxID=2904119 RepID=UPI0025436E66|nr:bifunctional [glutamate--ammonia ligase]-adenylyl-L-tyrosine phosphorylase/[glutamate--ammonia-ligase] adenylyltransferase [Moraxella sp. ZY171148]WII96215.1 bifunctional [glutamate--ammonia ligase]-adenylyl-L-tyrosine phosphorylase/[glutamate--ammonia-ligase] adenylyltransferase [Moraxella sp. ZY171148]